MIGKEGQFIASFKVDDTEIVSLNTLERFLIVEEAGNVLPTFELIFRVIDTSILGLIHEDMTIDVAIGRDKLEIQNIKLKPVKKDVHQENEISHLVSISGVYDALGYINNPVIHISDKSSAIQVIKETASKYFKVKMDVEKSTDIQHWVQPNESDKDFINHLWSHCDLGEDNFPVLGITSEGEFILRTIDSVLKEKPRWNFSLGDEKDAILFDPDYQIKSISGLANAWKGYDRSMIIEDLDTGKSYISKSKTTNKLSSTKKTEKSSDVKDKVSRSKYINTNTHKRFNESYANNLANAVVYSSNTITLNISSAFYPFKIFDLARWKDGLGKSKQSSESYSGSWVISKVARIISRGSLITSVVLCRESMNHVTGKSDKDLARQKKLGG